MNEINRRIYVQFEFTGNLKKNKRKQKLVINRFMKQRSLLVDILNNGILDVLNAEFNATHEWYEGIYYDKEYMKFIQEGEQKWADIVNKNADPDIGIELFIDEEGEIYGKTTTYWSDIPEEVHMYII